MTGAAEDDKSYFQRFCDYMRRDTKGVEVCWWEVEEKC